MVIWEGSRRLVQNLCPAEASEACSPIQSIKILSSLKQERNANPFRSRCAFGKGVGAEDGRDLLGVFAVRDIPEGGVVMADTTKTFGCTGPGRDGTSDNLHGGLGCQDPLHPNCDEDTTDQDLRWIRDRCGTKAAEVILRCGDSYFP